MLIVILSILVITFTLAVISWVIQQECDICELIEEEQDVKNSRMFKEKK